MQNSMVMFTFSAFDWKYPFWVNLVQNIKIISLSQNLLPRPIRICRINGVADFFLLTGTNSFWANLVEKIKLVSFS